MCLKKVQNILWINFVHLFFPLSLLKLRVLYDRILMTKIDSEITAFLNSELGTSRARNSKSNKNNNKNFFVYFYYMFRIFPLLKFLVYNPKRW